MTKCNKVQVPKDCCYLRFKKGNVKHSKDIGYTARGEQIIIDYDKNEDVLGIELLSSKEAPKPCMDSQK